MATTCSTTHKIMSKSTTIVKKRATQFPPKINTNLVTTLIMSMNNHDSMKNAKNKHVLMLLHVCDVMWRLCNKFHMLHLNLNLKGAFNMPRNKAFCGHAVRTSLACLECNVINWPLHDDVVHRMFYWSKCRHIKTIVSSVCRNRTSLPGVVFCK